MTCDKIITPCLRASCGQVCHLTFEEVQVQAAGISHVSQLEVITDPVVVTSRIGTITTVPLNLGPLQKTMFQVQCPDPQWLPDRAVILVSLQLDASDSGVGIPYAYVTQTLAPTSSFYINLANLDTADTMTQSVTVAYTVLASF